jgi:hypothetical protein
LISGGILFKFKGESVAGLFVSLIGVPVAPMGLIKMNDKAEDKRKI